MAKFPKLPLYTDAIMGDTMHLTAEQLGAYMLMLMVAWRSKDNSLPDDDVYLARITRLTKRKWDQNKQILREFWSVEDGRLRQKKLDYVKNSVTIFAKKQKENVESRWLKNKETADTTVLPDVCQKDTFQNHIHNNISLPSVEISRARGKNLEKSVSNTRNISRETSTATRLSPDWQLPMDWGRWAEGQGVPGELIVREADRFRDYWLALAGARGKKLDWEATWRNWIRRTIDDGKLQTAGAAGRAGSQFGETFGRTHSAVAGYAGAGKTAAGDAEPDGAGVGAIALGHPD